MNNTHICLNCKTKQPKPYPIIWCCNCFSYLVYSDESFLSTQGYIYLSESVGKHRIETARRTPKFSTIIHKIHCDVIGLAQVKLIEPLHLENWGGEFILSQEQVDYIKTIERFEDGKFHFKGEDEGETNYG